jgi:hypothetical protein
MRKLLLAVIALAVVALPAVAQGPYKAKMTINSYGTSTSGTFSTVVPPKSYSYESGVSPYNANIALVGSLPPGTYGPFGPSIDVYCVDFFNSWSGGTQNMWVTNIASDPTTYTRSTNMLRYKHAAWLANKTKTNPAVADRAALQGAMWQVMAGVPVRHNTVAIDAGIAYWVGQAFANWNDGSVNFGNWSVLTQATVTGTTAPVWGRCVTQSTSNGTNLQPPRDEEPADGYASATWASSGCVQEFVAETVPEPATLILLGTGLLVTLAAAGVLRRPAA